MATTIGNLTYADLDDIPCERPGDRHELIDGELFVTPSPIPAHQIVSINIVVALVLHVREHNLGAVLDAPIDLRLTPDNVLVPDIIFIAQERAHIIGPKAVDAAPELVVEILSPGTRQRDQEVKRDLYARFGVQEYWIVDPKAKSVTVLALTGARYEQLAAGQDGVMQSRVLPHLHLSLESVFAGVA